jgi:hypothetical protein
LLELNYSDTAGSAAKPVVDSKNPSLIAVGAVDPPLETHLGLYSSRGPTTDGRMKPDLTAPAGMYSTVYAGNFSGTSAASPSAAGVAALLAGEGLGRGVGLAALVRHFVVDRGVAGPDNNYGVGEVSLPPPAAAPTPPGAGRFVAAAGTHPGPVRLLDTRTAAAPRRGPFGANAVIDVPVVGTAAVPTPVDGAHITAVALDIVSVGSASSGIVQAYPYLRAATGAYATFRVPSKGATTSSFAIVPVGADGKVSLFAPAGGQFVIDVLGWFDDHTPTATAAGRFVPLATPERWLDARLPGGTAQRVPVKAASAVPATGVGALVLHVTVDRPGAAGYLQVVPDSAGRTDTSTLDFGAAQTVGNDTIVGVGPHGTVDITASTPARSIVDVVGYITSATSAPQGALFTPFAQVRRYHSATSPFTAGEARQLTLTGGGVPADSTGLSVVLTVGAGTQAGYLSDWFGGAEPASSVLNYRAGTTVAGGALVGLAGGQLHVKSSAAGTVAIDVNGSFQIPPP